MGAYLINCDPNLDQIDRSAAQHSVPENLSQLIEGMELEAVTLCNLDGFILKANRKVEETYGWPLEEVEGFHSSKFCTQGQLRRWEELAHSVTETISKDREWRGVVREQTRSNEKVPMLLKYKLLDSFVVCYARQLPTRAPFKLSPRQAEIFALLGGGWDVDAIADELDCRSSTIRTHIQRICEKVFTGLDRETNLHELQAIATQCILAGWTNEIDPITLE